MLEVLKTAIEMFQWYIGESWQYVLFLLALLYLLLSREEKDKRKLFIGYTLIFGFLYLFPVTAKIIMKYCSGELVYWRMFWILPIPMILAYVGTKIWRRQKSKTTRVLSLAVMIALIVISGRCVYGEETPFQKAGNLLKLPPEVCWVCDIVKENAPSDGELKVVAPAELVGYIRQYDPKIQLAYGRRDIRGRKRKRIAKQMLEESPDFAMIAKYARALDCDFLIYPADEWQDETIQMLGYEVVGSVNTYMIYRDANVT